MYMCVCMSVFVIMQIHMYVYIQAYIHTYIYIYVYTHVCTLANMYEHTHCPTAGTYTNNFARSFGYGMGRLGATSFGVWDAFGRIEVVTSPRQMSVGGRAYVVGCPSMWGWGIWDPELPKQLQNSGREDVDRKLPNQLRTFDCWNQSGIFDRTENKRLKAPEQALQKPSVFSLQQ